MDDSTKTNTISLWLGAAPGSDVWTQREQETLVFGNRVVRNVTEPTLTAFLPDPAKAIRGIPASRPRAGRER